jgi:hypothetical protein
MQAFVSATRLPPVPDDGRGLGLESVVLRGMGMRGAFSIGRNSGGVVARRAKSLSDGLPGDNHFTCERERGSLQTSSPTCRTTPDFAHFGHLETVSGE